MAGYVIHLAVAEEYLKFIISPSPVKVISPVSLSSIQFIVPIVPEVKEEQLPTEDLLRDLSRYSSSDFQYIYFVQLFYSIYLQ